MSDLPATAAEARAMGVKRYFTGAPCPAGHLSPRYASVQSCCECSLAANREFQRLHPKRVQEYTRQWLKRNPEKAKALAKRKREKELPREKERSKARYAKDPELAKAKARKWYDANLERALANAARWRNENRDAVKVAMHRRRASMKNAPGDGVTRTDIEALAKKQPGCPDCRVTFSKENPYTLDHVMPIVLGGAHDKSNIELRCYPCNNRKRARDPIAHARMLGRLV